jgi:hypothetical protein
MARTRLPKSVQAQSQPLNKQVLDKRRPRKLAMDRNKPATRKGPRLNSADRLSSRFYEPLILLHLMDRNGELRVSRCPSEDQFTDHLQLRELRRTFLDQLAYVCDHVKGGDTVTAIALEAQPSGVTFWVTSNSNFSIATTSFLKGILSTLQSLSFSPSDNSTAVIENDLSQRCIDFNLKRIKAYCALLQKPLKQCLAFLRISDEAEGKRPKNSSIQMPLTNFNRSDTYRVA